MSRNRRLLWLVVAVGVVALCAVVAALRLLGSLPLFGDVQSANSPEEIFRAVILDPIPPDVQGLAAGGDTWQGYRLWARFQASEETRARVVEGYEPTTCEEVLVAMADQSDDAAWVPQLVASPTCYQREAVSNGWTSFGTHYLLVDETNGVVYFFGIGS